MMLGQGRPKKDAQQNAAKNACEYDYAGCQRTHDSPVTTSPDFRFLRHHQEFEAAGLVRL